MLERPGTTRPKREAIPKAAIEVPPSDKDISMPPQEPVAASNSGSGSDHQVGRTTATTVASARLRCMHQLEHPVPLKFVILYVVTLMAIALPMFTTLGYQIHEAHQSPPPQAPAATSTFQMDTTWCTLEEETTGAGEQSWAIHTGGQLTVGALYLQDRAGMYVTVECTPTSAPGSRSTGPALLAHRSKVLLNRKPDDVEDVAHSMRGTVVYEGDRVASATCVFIAEVTGGTAFSFPHYGLSSMIKKVNCIKT